MLYTSDIVEKTFKLKPDQSLSVWEGEDTSCTHCARPVVKGECYENSNVGAFFSDTRDLANYTEVICWRCVILRKKPMLYGLGAAVITEDAIYSIHKDAEKAWLFTTPPKPPFLVVHSSSTMQHLSWRGRMTLDSRLIYLRYGPNLWTINREKVVKALAIADRINSDAKTATRWVNPLFLDRKFAMPIHGMVNPRAVELMTTEEITFFENLGPGELWALTYTMHSKRPRPEHGEDITRKVLDRLDK